ncbi:MAG: spore coat U domain-containing protein [Gammaproteobacteria bacterium]|nr:spore coat U domain-containing protein [Gammaproteobacteria bacterium]
MRRVLIFIVSMLVPIFSYATCTGKNCRCTIGTTTGLSFGNYSPIVSDNTDSTGTVTVNCSVTSGVYNVSYAINLSEGSGTFTNRTLKYDNKKLNYNLYTSGTMSTVWGDGSDGSSNVTDSYTSSGKTGSRNYTVYGRIPGQQAVPAGSYSDVVTVTVEF